MKLYIVIRWGSDNTPEGPNGPDTHFLVRATDRDDAAGIVDQQLRDCIPHRTVEPQCHMIVMIGEDSTRNIQSEILLGPYYATIGFRNSREYLSWIREDQTDYEWVDDKEWFKEELAEEKELPNQPL